MLCSHEPISSRSIWVSVHACTLNSSLDDCHDWCLLSLNMQ